MPFSKIREEFVRPNAECAFLMLISAHVLAVAICLLYPIIMYLGEYSDARLMSREISNFQHFADNTLETVQWYFFYSLPAFLVATGLYLSRFFQLRIGFRRLTYLATFAVIFATLHLDTSLDVLGHWSIYLTAAFYVAFLFVIAALFEKRCGTVK